MTTEQILSGFTKLAVLVVGDICLDRWCTYDPELSEPSRETGIPRIAVVSTEVTPGAGGTVANNLVALEANRVAVLGVVGDDGFGEELQRALEARSISTEFLVKAPVPTFTYTKLINAKTGVEDQPRVDYINAQPLPEETERKILTRLESAVGGYGVIIVADQAETDCGGVVTPAMRQMLSDLATRNPDKVFWADSRKRIEQFRRVVVKPNRQEADEACMRLFGKVDYQALREHLEAGLMIVTQGPEGVVVVEPGRETPVRTRPVENPVDICGAGDSFTAGAAMALAVTGQAVEAARIGNLVASVTIMKKGTGTASPQEVLQAEARQR
ncbi:MAG TPA: PfkB family carbohydrate kinase [Bryobacteraceae bacterium]|nr:PfkB family carbohydrate kinase [Bryobacteraceae bacterium]HPU72829.1 PfkB family carbohydrate kinase [Bryobacteraceae bacterium]